MARLLLDTGGKHHEAFELGLGVNRLGRAPDCDFQLDHYSVSGVHCELVLSAQGLLLRDCGATNGTLVDGQPVKEMWLTSGQVIQDGAIKLTVEIADAPVVIPKLEVNIPAPPVVLTDGGTLCRRHPKIRATHRCTHCHELLCDVCVHRLRRKGGELHLFCALCSHHCEPLGPDPGKRRRFLGLLKSTIRIPFTRKKPK
jgi:predicted component of type VI protein secretion system